MYLRTFFSDWKPRTRAGPRQGLISYWPIDKHLYKKLNNLHRRAKRSGVPIQTGGFASVLTLIRRGKEKNYEQIRDNEYIIIYAPLNPRDQTVDVNTFAMYCGARKNGKFMKMVKIPIEVQFILFLELQNEIGRK